MSSKIPYIERTQRGKITHLNQLPEPIQKMVLELKNAFGDVRLFGSYAGGYWADDSDIDIAIPEPAKNRKEALAIAEKHHIKMCIIGIQDYLTPLKGL